MPTLSIKDVPEPVAQALREKARLNHRSLQGELMAMVMQAIQPTHGHGHGLEGGYTVSQAAGSASGLKSIEQIAHERLGRRAADVAAGGCAQWRGGRAGSGRRTVACEGAGDAPAQILQ